MSWEIMQCTQSEECPHRQWFVGQYYCGHYWHENYTFACLCDESTCPIKKDY